MKSLASITEKLTFQIHQITLLFENGNANNNYSKNILLFDKLVLSLTKKKFASKHYIML